MKKQHNFRLDAVIMAMLIYIKKKERRSEANVIEKAIEEYFLNHYETHLEELINAYNIKN